LVRITLEFMENLKIRLDKLENILKNYKRVTIAFSGGKDSFFLARKAIEVLGKDNVKLFFITSELIGKNDRKRAEYFKNRYNLEIKILDIHLLDNRKIRDNENNRCYYCKKTIFNRIIKEAGIYGIKTVLDGTTYSDRDEFRPGLKAIDELGIVSPLKDAEINSKEIVSVLKNEGNIDDYYLTSSTCLATRFPYKHSLSEKEIDKFGRIESFLVDKGIYPVRVRYIKDGIRVETEESLIPKILNIKDDLINISKEEELRFVTVDLEGIKSGVWD